MKVFGPFATRRTSNRIGPAAPPSWESSGPAGPSNFLRQHSDLWIGEVGCHTTIAFSSANLAWKDPRVPVSVDSWASAA